MKNIYLPVRQFPDSKPEIAEEDRNVARDVHKGEYQHSYCSVVLDFITSVGRGGCFLGQNQHGHGDGGRDYDRDDRECKRDE